MNLSVVFARASQSAPSSPISSEVHFICTAGGLCRSPVSDYGNFGSSQFQLPGDVQVDFISQRRLRSRQSRAYTARCISREQIKRTPTLQRRIPRIVRAGSRGSSGAAADDEKETEPTTSSKLDAGTTEDAGVDPTSNSGPVSHMWSALSAAVMHFFRDFRAELKSETGFDSEAVGDKLIGKYYAVKKSSGEMLIHSKAKLQSTAREVRGQAISVTQVVQDRYWPQFVNWNSRESWQDGAHWDVQRVGAFVFYILVFGSCLRGVHKVLTTPRLGKASLTQLADAYMESVIPEPTTANVQKLRKAMWREEMPKGLSLRKYKIGEDDIYERDYDFPGDNPEETIDAPDFDANKAIDESDLFTAEEKEELKKDILESKSTHNLQGTDNEKRARIGFDINDFIDELDEMPTEEKDQLKKDILEEKARQAVHRTQSEGGQEDDLGQSEVRPIKSWQERLEEWGSVLKTASASDALEVATSKYGVDLGQREEMDPSGRAKQEETSTDNSLTPFWVARKWWKHRPTLPYTYLIDKIQNDEVRTAVFTEDMRRLYVSMKEGFPTDYIVDLPVDPSLYALLEGNGVEIGILHQSDVFYYGRIFVVLLPSLLLIWYIRELQYLAKERASESIYDLLSMNRQHLILPEDAASKARSQYKDVVVGGDIWQVIDEIMIYMRNPMKYFNQQVKLPRGILISGPPGTGKTLLARAIARESGLPFVFASGAEFVESGTGTGTDKAPSFIFIDEIDALAGKNAKDDAERRATFEQLLSELDGEPEDTDVNRFAPRQAVILICATNRPDELDEELMRPGRIDREIHIGLPAEEERVGIFNVHSHGKRMANDVDFNKLVFRTIGYSGADIRNLINEAGIMAIRKGHEEISQQDLSEVLDKQLFEGMGVVLMDDEQKRAEQKIPGESKRLLAVHEAGHVLLAHLFPTFDWHAFTHLLPGGSETAVSVFYPRQEMLQLGHTTVGYVMMQMVVAHGGRCAERLLYGDHISDGGQDDLARISAMARELAISQTNSRLGLLPMTWRDRLDPPKLPDEVELIPKEWEKPGTQIANMTVELSELFTREVTKYSEETEDIAMASLKQNQQILERLADVLLSKTKISGFEAEDIIKSMNPVPLPDFMDSGPKITFREREESVASIGVSGRYEDFTVYAAPLHKC